MLVLNSLVVVFSALAFPSVIPWMIAFWLACHMMLAAINRPAWVPLVICLLILIAKMVPRAPAMLTFLCILAVVIAIRVRRGTRHDREARWWACPLLLWVSWAFVNAEWRAMERCDSARRYVAERPIVCVGDSLTDGLLPDRGYPEQLKGWVTAPVINLGMSGISTVQGLGLMERALSHQPQVVVIELGGHDFLKGHGRRATKANLIAMIDQCREADVDVVLMEIPRGFIFDPYASLEREIAYETDVQLVPDTWLRQIVILGPASPPGMWMSELRLSDDGIHSNRRGSEAIARRVAAALAQMYGDDVLSRRL